MSKAAFDKIAAGLNEARSMVAHDTPEVVEAVTRILDEQGFCDEAAMLRRLHKRATDAERERDEANTAIAYQADQLDGCTHAYKEARAALATARADALREAAAVTKALPHPEPDAHFRWTNGFEEACETASSTILSLIHPTTTGET